ncbi:MAG: pyridoxal 5'-phosphate synthase glutaminase subunit PdxT [Micrococcales bacterium]
MTKPVGVLALQGDFREHLRVLERLGQLAISVRTPDELAQISGLIIPGGESTVMHKLSVAYGLFDPIRRAIGQGLPVFGTCAGLIMLADRIIDGIEGQQTFGGLDVSVRRNAFGHQTDSFEIDLDFAGIEGSVHAAFIRAPLVESHGAKVQIVAELPDGRIVGVRQGNLLGISFHPEVTNETRVHELFLKMISDSTK